MCVSAFYTRTQKNMWNKCKNHSLNEYGCRDAPCKKSWKQGNPLSNTIKDTSTIMRNPSLHNSGKGLRMIVLVSLIVLLRGLFPRFFAWCIPTSIIIHSMNDFCTCIERSGRIHFMFDVANTSNGRGHILLQFRHEREGGHVQLPH